MESGDFGVYPCKTNKLPREIPSPRWFQSFTAQVRLRRALLPRFPF